MEERLEDGISLNSGIPKVFPVLFLITSSVDKLVRDVLLDGEGDI